MDVSTLNIKVTKTEKSRIDQVDFSDIQFGKIYSDHMFVVCYEDGAWQAPEIIPFQHLSLSPATTFIHYGQAIFEGVKAYKNPQGDPIIFRPAENWKRMNRSAARMAMPEISEKLFVGGMQALIHLDRDWVPVGGDTALYVRPFMFATDEFIGVRPAEKFMFVIITSPAGPYYSKPVSIYVQDKYVRAFPGGIGFTKAAGNYGMCMYPTAEVRKMGYDQILWTDGFEHKYVQEIGTMNVFFIIGDKAVTPDINHDTILAGVTRDSVIALLKDKGIEVEERQISIDELVEAYHNGTLKEAFGTGTAASIAPIRALTYDETTLNLPPVESWEVAGYLKKALADIRYGLVEDTKGWTLGV